MEQSIVYFTRGYATTVTFSLDRISDHEPKNRRYYYDVNQNHVFCKIKFTKEKEVEGR